MRIFNAMNWAAFGYLVADLFVSLAVTAPQMTRVAVAAEPLKPSMGFRQACTAADQGKATVAEKENGQTPNRRQAATRDGPSELMKTAEKDYDQLPPRRVAESENIHGNHSRFAEGDNDHGEHARLAAADLERAGHARQGVATERNACP